MMMAADRWYIYNGRDGAVIPPDVTRVRIHESLSVIPFHAFYGNRHIEELECHFGVKTVKGYAFRNCTSLRRVIMRGVEEVRNEAFCGCKALTIVECDKLEIIRHHAFAGCRSLGGIDLPSAKIIGGTVFNCCKALTNIKFGKELESIGWCAFRNCTSLERVTIPLKDGMITENDTFSGCENLKHVDLVEGVRGTIDALLLDEWRNDMNEEINSINQILPTVDGEDTSDDGGKALAIRMWIRSVLGKIIHYKAQHQRVLEEAAATLKVALHQDIMNNVLPFLELPSYTFEVVDHEDEDEEGDSDDEEDDDGSSY